MGLRVWQTGIPLRPGKRCLLAAEISGGIPPLLSTPVPMNPYQGQEDIFKFMKKYKIMNRPALYGIHNDGLQFKWNFEKTSWDLQLLCNKHHGPQLERLLSGEGRHILIREEIKRELKHQHAAEEEINRKRKKKGGSNDPPRQLWRSSQRCGSEEGGQGQTAPPFQSYKVHQAKTVSPTHCSSWCSS